MFERIIINLHKRSINRKLKRARLLLKKRKERQAEREYNNLLHEYKIFCTRATYMEKLSIYHNLMHLYDRLSEIGDKEEKPESVKKSGAEKEIEKTGKKAGEKKPEEKKEAQREEKKEDTAEEEQKRDIAKENIAGKITQKPEEDNESNEEMEPEQGDAQKKPKPVKKGSLTTALDDLYGYVAEKGDVAFTQAASKFGVSKEKTEEWAKILEDHGLVKIYYPAFTSPRIMSLEWIRKKEEEQRRKTEARKRKKKSSKRKK